jgi:hypothetical protein
LIQKSFWAFFLVSMIWLMFTTQNYNNIKNYCSFKF